MSVTEQELKPFPETGHTLVVNGIGQRSVPEVSRFLKALDIASYLYSKYALAIFILYYIIYI